MWKGQSKGWMACNQRFTCLILRGAAFISHAARTWCPQGPEKYLYFLFSTGQPRRAFSGLGNLAIIGSLLSSFGCTIYLPLISRLLQGPGPG